MVFMQDTAVQKWTSVTAGFSDQVKRISATN